MARMSNKRRLAGRDNVERKDNSQLAPYGDDPSEAAVPELDHLREALAAAGAPGELISRILSAQNADEAMRLLAESGLIPPEDEVLARMLDGFEPLLKPGTSALDAELSGAEFLALLRATAQDPEDVVPMLADLMAQSEESGKPEALAMLRVLAVTAPRELRSTATAAADRMVAGGMRDCRWVNDLGSPRVGACFGYADEMQRAITITFGYGRKHHAVAVLIDYSLGGGVKDCWLTDTPDRMRAEFQRAAHRAGLDFLDHDPAEARVILDQALAQPPCPEAPDQIEDVDSYLDLLRQRVALLPEGGTVGATGAKAKAKGRARTVHRLKINLHGAKPPIWRRVEVPSTITLQQLHQIIQYAFGWHDCHMWVFETAAGEYGQPDPDLGHRSAASKKLQDVAPTIGDRIGYTYDFGDDWRHEIVVEDVLDAEPGVAYPRCVAGRRACPPEDCGGLWGYTELLEILANPEHEEHEERLRWLGLDAADHFDPAAFDASTVNEALAGIARVLVKS